jgi:GNAT superfamily N-acetyltransferase
MYGTFGTPPSKQDIDNITFTTTLSRAIVRTCMKEHVYVKKHWLMYQNYLHILSAPPFELKQFNFKLIVAWLDNKPVGVMIMTGTTNRHSNVFVVPEYRRLGIATKLLTVASEIKEPNDLLCFTTHNLNTPIIRLSKTFPEIRQLFWEPKGPSGKVIGFTPIVQRFKEYEYNV